MRDRFLDKFSFLLSTLFNHDNVTTYQRGERRANPTVCTNVFSPLVVLHSHFLLLHRQNAAPSRYKDFFFYFDSNPPYQMDRDKSQAAVFFYEERLSLRFTAAVPTSYDVCNLVSNVKTNQTNVHTNKRIQYGTCVP